MSAPVIKIAFGEQIRRLPLDNGTPSFAEVSKVITTLFEGLPEKWVLQYKDDEGDVITISTEREFAEAVQLLKKLNGSIRFTITSSQPPKVSSTPNSAPQNPFDFLTSLLQGVGISVEKEAQPQHPFAHYRRGFCPRGAFAQGETERKENPDFHRAFCDGCKNRIPANQTRYKCNDCADFDFCESCRWSVPHHGTHSFIEIKDPKLTVHRATCDGCQITIVGDRYKCRECPDYDLCSKCIENKTKIHPDHAFAKLERPWGVHGIPFGCRRFGGCSRGAPQQESNNNAKVVIPEQPKAEEPKSAEVVVEKKEAKPFEQELKQLKEMGFLNEEMNVNALKQVDGDLANAVRRLLGM